jgi:iron complex transport system substrate-binding protein
VKIIVAGCRGVRMDEWSMIGEWRQVPIKLLDIRRVTLQQGKEAQPYCLPANMFLFAAQGEAHLRLDGVQATNTCTQLLHGGKGACLEIECITSIYVYYVILYKPLDKPTASRKRSGGTVPLAHRYVFRSTQPWLLQALVEQMHRLWTDGGELEKLQTFGLFYQFVYEQFRQLQFGEQEKIEPDLAEAIALYIQRHYREAISMDTLASLFHYSTHYLSRVFKRKYGCSPVGFLVRTRMSRAKDLLVETDIAVRDIAESVGYADMYYFNKLFKKQIGSTPVQFKFQILGLKSSIRAKITSKSFIAPQADDDYIVNSDSENHYQQYVWGVNEVNVNMKPSFAVSLLFGLSLLLAACGGADTNSEQMAQQENGQRNEASPAPEATAGTRPYTDALGRQVEIPVQPSKVVVVTYGGYLLPLGMKPVGADQGTLEQYPKDMAGVKNIGEGLGNEETILGLQPDLIIVPDYFDAAKYANYEKIAPTIAVAWGGDPDVVNTLRTMGDIMNRKSEAEAWITKFEEKLQRIRDQIDVKIEQGTTAMTFIFYEKEFLVGGEGGTLGKLIYQDYGFQMPEQLKPFADGGTALSIEAFVDQPADYFFTQMTDEEMANLTQLFQAPLYQSIPAVKNNRIINVTREKWNYGPYLVDEAVNELIAQMNKLQ